jgi:phosphoserine phosphatase RsbU/P
VRANQASGGTFEALHLAHRCNECASVATLLGNRLRPRFLPQIDGVRLATRYRPAAGQLDIGGDFYDVHGEEGDWLLCLGDVRGKGVAAAALNARVRQSIRTARCFDRRPDAALGALNTVLHDEAAGQFVTVVCVRVRLNGDGSLRTELASAGHPKPVVLRADSRVEQVDVGGAVAGMFAETAYRRVPIQLDPGDTMLLFSDGIDEAFGAGGQGVDWLLALLPQYAGARPEVLCEVIERYVVEYLDGRTHDMALLAVTCGS